MARSMLFGVLLAVSSLVEGEGLQVPEIDVTSRWTTVDGVTVHFRDSGQVTSPSNPPLLLIHGWLGSSYDFHDFMNELPRSIRVVAPDLPGCGLSQKTGINYTPDYYITLLAKLLRSLQIPRAVVVGHSMGGGIAVNFASRFPTLVERLVLIDPDGLRGEEGFLGVIRRLHAVVDLVTALNNRLTISIATRVNVFHDPSRVTRGYLDSVALTCLTPQGRRAQAEITKHVLGCSPVDDILPHLDLPTLVLWGEEDRLLSPKWAARYRDLIPSAQLVMIPESGHMPQIESAKLVAGVILDFLNFRAGVP